SPREQVEHTDELVRLEQRAQGVDVHAGHWHVGDEAEDHQHRASEQELRAQVGNAEGVDGRTDHGYCSSGSVAVAGGSAAGGSAAGGWGAGGSVAARLRAGRSAVAFASAAGCLRGFNSCTVPPAASIFARACAETRSTCTSRATPISPSPSSLIGPSPLCTR